MKHFTTMLLLMTGIITYSCAQDTTCNRAVYLESFEKQLPKEVCLPDGYMIRKILSDTVDINGDGRVDFAAKLQKMESKDGDTTLVLLYRQNEMGAYEEWKIFNNLFPIYLKDYQFNYYRDHHDRSFFMELRRRYDYPEFSDVLFEQNTIVVKFNVGSGGGLLLYFTYEKKIDSWKLTKQTEWYGLRGRVEEIIYSSTPQNQYDIREFNMLDYLDEVRYE